MARRRRVLLFIRWTFTTSCVLALASLVASRWWQLRYNWVTGSGRAWMVWMGGGQVVANSGFDPAAFASGWALAAAPSWTWGWGAPENAQAAWRWRYGCLWVHLPGGFGLYGVSGLYPLLLTAIPAALLWRRDLRVRRRERAGACTYCGYDRRGIAPGAACPECGAKGNTP